MSNYSLSFVHGKISAVVIPNLYVQIGYRVACTAGTCAFRPLQPSWMAAVKCFAYSAKTVRELNPQLTVLKHCFIQLCYRHELFRCGVLQSGDRILSINGYPCDQCTFDDVNQLLSDAYCAGQVND